MVEGRSGVGFIIVRVVPFLMVREPDGLAMSSRNRLLSRPQRERAPAFPRLLARSVAERRSAVEAAADLRREGFTVDYVEDYGDRRLGGGGLGNVGWVVKSVR